MLSTAAAVHKPARAASASASALAFSAVTASYPQIAAAQDDDPYVRKTAAVCVAKLFDINPELVEDRGFLDTLKVGNPGCQELPQAN